MTKRTTTVFGPCLKPIGKTQENNDGYLVRYCKVRKRPVYPHIEACIAQNGARPSPFHKADHMCENRKCCNPKHMRWATNSQNLQMKHANPNPAKRPSPETVLYAVAEHRNGRTCTDLANELGYDRKTVSGWVNGHRFSSLTGITPRQRTYEEKLTWDMKDAAKK